MLARTLTEPVCELRSQSSSTRAGQEGPPLLTNGFAP